MFTPNRIVTLTSDFGDNDGYVGAMKGVMLRVSPTLKLVDIAHHIPPQDVLHGAFLLKTSAPLFPVGSVHLAVVDPGVGTSRESIVLCAGDQLFVGPDNGLFHQVSQSMGGVSGCYVIRDHPYLPAVRSNTFHGRDLFAPTAAALAAGFIRPEAIGPPHEPLSIEGSTRTSSLKGGLLASVVAIDRFGNLITDLYASVLSTLGRPEELHIIMPGGEVVPYCRTYAEVAPEALVAVVGSTGQLEVAVRDGSAAARLGLSRGAEISIELISED